MSQHIDEDEVRAITGAWDYRSLPDNVQIGSDCFLARRDSFRRFRSTRDQGLILGNRVIVYTWAEFNIEPSGFLSVGDDSILVGPVFMCAESIRIGRRVVISYNVTIADSDFHPLDAASRKADAVANAPEGSAANRPAIVSDPVTIDDDAWVGIGAIILKGVRIGKAARIGAGAVVTSDVPAGASVAGNPARIVDAGPES